MRYASIDIGTNTILMLIGDIDETLSLTPIKDYYSVPRLGKSVSTAKKLSRESIERATGILSGYRDMANQYGVDKIVASATSAVRDAENRDEFVATVREACGIDVEVIEGRAEARLGFLGALSSETDKSKRSLVVDIGGGSTEFSFGAGTEPSLCRSLNVGAVRITEMFFKHSPPLEEELRIATGFVDDALSGFPFSDIRPQRVFAVAGTPTTLALIYQKRYEFDPDAVNNYRMSAQALEEIFLLLKKKSPQEIKQLTRAAEGREDVLLAGALILLESLRLAGAGEFLATDRGLRHGYLLYKHLRMLNG